MEIPRLITLLKHLISMKKLILIPEPNSISGVNPDSVTGANCDSQVDFDFRGNSDSGANSDFETDSEADSVADSGIDSQVNSRIGPGVKFGIGEES